MVWLVENTTNCILASVVKRLDRVPAWLKKVNLISKWVGEPYYGQQNTWLRVWNVQTAERRNPMEDLAQRELQWLFNFSHSNYDKLHTEQRPNFQHTHIWDMVFSCPGQLNRWYCHSVSQWVSQTFDFWFTMTIMTTMTTMTTITTMTTMTTMTTVTTMTTMTTMTTIYI